MDSSGVLRSKGKLSVRVKLTVKSRMYCEEFMTTFTDFDWLFILTGGREIFLVIKYGENIFLYQFDVTLPFFLAATITEGKRVNKIHWLVFS